VGVSGGLADPVQEIDRKVVLVLCQPHFPSEGVQVVDESGYHLPQPRVRSAGHCAKIDVGDVIGLFDDAVGRHRFRRRWRICFHRICSNLVSCPINNMAVAVQKGADAASVCRAMEQPAAQSGHRKMLLGAIETRLSHDSLRSLQILRP